MRRQLGPGERQAAEAVRQHFGGEARGRWALSGGLGGMGGAQPLAAVLAGLSFLGVEVDASRAQKRLETRYNPRRYGQAD